MADWYTGYGRPQPVGGGGSEGVGSTTDDSGLAMPPRIEREYFTLASGITDDDGDGTEDAVEVTSSDIAVKTLIAQHGNKLTPEQALGIASTMTQSEKERVRGYFLDEPLVHRAFLPEVYEETSYDEKAFVHDFSKFCTYRDDKTVAKFLTKRLPSLSLGAMYKVTQMLYFNPEERNASLDVALSLLPPNCELIDTWILGVLTRLRAVANDKLKTKIDTQSLSGAEGDINERVQPGKGTFHTILENKTWTGQLEFRLRVVKKYSHEFATVVPQWLAAGRAAEVLELLDLLESPAYADTYEADKTLQALKMKRRVFENLKEMHAQLETTKYTELYTPGTADADAFQTYLAMERAADGVVTAIDKQIEQHEEVVRMYLHRFMPKG